MTNTSETSSNNLLGELIKKIRSINNLTQGKFGKIFEPSVTQSTVARWEKGEQNPDRIHFPKIASLLNLSFEEFIEFIEQPISKIEDLNIENKTLTYNERHLSMLKKELELGIVGERRIQMLFPSYLVFI
ncbi:MAG: helix-turn-helix transcriptional regulator [Pleurocapsa sp. CRU_1_2]|nr:helix-turn-helix transcriptional regulator [Pleurocapsa sp. CRU_1_2]